MNNPLPAKEPDSLSRGPKTQVVLVGAVRLYCDGLADLLARTDGIDVVGTAASVEAALSLVADVAPDVVLVDIAMAGGLDLARMLRRRADARVVVLAVPDEESAILACAEAGISGLVTRDATVAELVESIVTAGRDELACTPRVAALLLRRVAALGDSARVAADRRPLTVREREIVGLLEDGLSNKEIAARLFIEVATVKNHVHNILGKLDVATRADITRTAWRGEAQARI